MAEDPDDTFYELVESDEEDRETTHKKTGVLLTHDANEVLSDQGAIVYESCLRTLATLQIPQHCSSRNCGLGISLHSGRVGTAIHLTWVCMCQ